MGSLILTATIVFALLGFSWAGTKYDWDSWQILGLFGGAIICLIIFILFERKAKSPILPLNLFKNDIFTISNAICFVIGVSMFGGVMYVPYFIQGVLGFSATHSSFLTMTMTLGLVFASAIGGQIITRTGKYKIQAIVGLCISSLGLYLLSTMDMSTSQYTLVSYLILVGFGLGIGLTVFTLTVQNAVDQSLLGVATASSQLFRSVGGTVGVAIMGTLLNSRMKDKMETMTQNNETNHMAVSPELAGKMKSLQNPRLLLDHEKLGQVKSMLPKEVVPLFENIIHSLQEALTYALSGVFLFCNVYHAASSAADFLFKGNSVKKCC